MALGSLPRERSTETQVRTVLATAAAGTAVGITLAVLDMALLGSVVTVGSLLALVYAVHRFGRVGADRQVSRRRRRRGY